MYNAPGAYLDMLLALYIELRILLQIVHAPGAAVPGAAAPGAAAPGAYLGPKSHKSIQPRP